MEVFNKAVEEEFGRKGPAIVEKNIEAVRRGAEFIMEQAGGPLDEFKLAPADGEQKLFMIGNEAIGLGAIAAGCRFMSAYPITPASEIMEYLIKKLPKFGGTVVQTEDEIAAVTMAIGADYGGVRAMTASAGPGLSLMMEAIGLSGMTETPLVIVDTQRGGPSTGLPTKQEQSDINALDLRYTRGNSEGRHCAEHDRRMLLRYDRSVQHCGEISMSGHYHDGFAAFPRQAILEALDYDKIVIDRGKLVTDDLPELEDHKLFKRYELTEDGISPRVIPGQKNGIHHVTGVEHDEEGRPSENAMNREKMMDKRLRQDARTCVITNAIKADAPHEEPDLLIIGMGSTGGTIDEAREPS